MGFWSKVANVATGGLSGMAKPLLRGNVKGALMGAATGGLYAGKNGRGGGPRGIARNLRAMRDAPAPMAGAQDYMNTFSPEDQANIKASWGGNRNGMNDWFSAAQGAGAVPKPAAPAAPAAGGPQPQMLGFARSEGAPQPGTGMAAYQGQQMPISGGRWNSQAADTQGDMGIMQDIQRRRMTAKLGGMLE